MNPLNRLPPELERQVSAEVGADELLLWTGQPDRSRMARMGTCPALFGIPFTLFALIWIVMAGGFAWFGGHAVGGKVSGLFGLFPLFGLPFLLVGLGLMLSPLWLGLKAARTAYAVTNKRVIIFEGGFWGGVTVRTVAPAQVADRSRAQNPDGSGDLIFNRLTTVQYDSDGDRSTRRVGFYGISDVHGVDELIRRTFEDTKTV